MKKSGLSVLVLLLVLNCSSQSIAQTRCDNLKKGVNLSNWLEAFWVPDWPDSTFYNRQMLVELKAAGIKSLRLPICFALVIDTAMPYNVDTGSRVFRVIDSVIKWTGELNMNLIIDNQHQWIVNDSTWRKEEPRIAHLWSVLAQRYNYLNPDNYFFEIFNEPNGINNDSLNLFFAPVIDTIRKYAPMHTLVASSNSWSNGLGYYNYQPLADTNLIYTFHTYDPYPFTHQGLSFVQPPLPTGLTYPNSGYDFLISFSWQETMLWRNTFNRPVFVGEFGVGIGADDESRCNWMDTVGRLIDENHLSAFYWDVRGDFQLYHSGIITEDSLIACFKHPLHLYGDTLSSVQNVDSELPVEIFPNPVKGTLHIRFNYRQTAEIKIINILGEEVMNKRTTVSETSMDVSSLNNGIYFVVITGDGKKLCVKKLIVTG